MPLNLAALTTTPGLPGAGGADYPDTAAACAAAWADAVEAWAAAILPASLTVTAAASALEGQLLAAFTAPDPVGVATLMDTAFTTFAVAVGAGMAGYTPTPPPAPVGFATLFAPPYPTTREEGVARFANAIDTWMRTGSSVLIAPPNTALIWS